MAEFDYRGVWRSWIEWCEDQWMLFSNSPRELSYDYFGRPPAGPAEDAPDEVIRRFAQEKWSGVYSPDFATIQIVRRPDTVLT